MLGQNHKDGFEAGQYIDVIKGDDENFIVSINIEEVKLGDALKALTEKIKVGLSWSADLDLNSPVSVHAAQTDFYDVLNRMLEDNGLEYFVSHEKRRAGYQGKDFG